jgi:hypothetical protein
MKSVDLVAAGPRKESNKNETNQARSGSDRDGEEEWEEKYSEKYKRKYWKNKSTGETSWKEPIRSESTSAPSVPKSGAESKWEEKYSEKYKRKYWKHKETGETSWKLPEDHSQTTAKQSNQSSVSSIVVRSELKESDEGIKSLSTNQSLNPLWEEKYSEKYQRKYWKHRESGETSWKPPTNNNNHESALEIKTSETIAGPHRDSKPSEEKPSIGHVACWEEKYSEKYKRKYWKNKETGETSWKPPPNEGVVRPGLVLANATPLNDRENSSDSLSRSESVAKKATDENSTGFILDSATDLKSEEPAPSRKMSHAPASLSTATISVPELFAGVICLVEKYKLKNALECKDSRTDADTPAYDKIIYHKCFSIKLFPSKTGKFCLGFYENEKRTFDHDWVDYSIHQLNQNNKYDPNLIYPHIVPLDAFVKLKFYQVSTLISPVV